MALTRTEAESVSTPFYTKKIVQQIYERDAFFWKLKKNNSITIDGGTEIRFPMRYAELENAKFVEPREQTSYTQKETRTSCKLDWKYLTSNAMVQWDERVKNAGKEKLVNLMADKAQELLDNVYEAMTDNLYATTQVAKGFSGLITIVDTTTTYADVSYEDAATWKASVEDSTTTRLILYGSGSLSESINACSFGDNKPTFAVTSRDLQSKVESLLQPQERFEDKETADAGFSNVKFRGIPIVGSAKCTAAYMYLLDMDKYELVAHSGWEFKVDEWEDLKQAGYPAALLKVMYWAGNLKCTMRRTSGRYSALDYTL